MRVREVGRRVVGRREVGRREVATVAVATVAVAAVVAATTLAAASWMADDDASGPPLAGITADTVDVGYVVPVQSQGFPETAYGNDDRLKVVEALVRWINANGGAGGRTLRTRYVDVDTRLEPTDLEAACTELTGDDPVFAAVLDGHGSLPMSACLRDAGTVVIDQTPGSPHDSVELEQRAGLLWSPTHPEYGSFLRKQLELTAAAGYFEGASAIHVVAPDDEVGRRAVDEIAVPFLEEQGFVEVAVHLVDRTAADLTLRGIDAAIAEASPQATTRIIAVGGGRLIPIALGRAAAADHPAVWSVSTFDHPGFLQDNPETVVADRLSGMLGAGYSAVADLGTVPRAQVPASLEPPLVGFPDPTNPAQSHCASIVEESGATFTWAPEPGREWANALLHCDALMFLKAALDRAPAGAELTAADVAGAVAGIGDGYRSALTLGGSWASGRYAWTDVVRPLARDDACACFVYTGEPVTLG